MSYSFAISSFGVVFASSHIPLIVAVLVFSLSPLLSSLSRSDGGCKSSMVVVLANPTPPSPPSLSSPPSLPSPPPDHHPHQHHILLFIFPGSSVVPGCLIWCAGLILQAWNHRRFVGHRVRRHGGTYLRINQLFIDTIHRKTTRVTWGYTVANWTNPCAVGNGGRMLPSGGCSSGNRNLFKETRKGFTVSPSISIVDSPLPGANFYQRWWWRHVKWWFLTIAPD